MNREWRVLYRMRQMGEQLGPMHTVDVVAHKEDDVREMMARVAPDAAVLDVTQVRGIIDWDQRNFDREEAGCYLRKTEKFIDRAMAEGDLPAPRKGYPIFTRQALDELISKRMKAA